MKKILIVDDDAALRFTACNALESAGHSTEQAENGQEAVDMCKAKSFDMVILDVNMPVMNGLQALNHIKDIDSSTIVLMLTAYADVKDAVVAMKKGAYDYVQKPINRDVLIEIVDKACEARELVDKAVFSAPVLNYDTNREIIGNSREINKVFNLIYKLTKVETSVLLRGESGTGKELVARAIHFNSHRKQNKFVAVNCAAIPENLIESELFGHEKGAFTGADKRKIGMFQYAEGGTLFLDEIGDISAQMQVKLLRVLQERKFVPVGGRGEIDIDVRIIAATNKDLEKMVQKETFRADLYYRLNVLPLFLPPLRQRKEDLELISRHLIDKFNRLHKRKIKGIADETFKSFLSYSWPGNIRELENVIEHSFIMESEDMIHPSSLPGSFHAPHMSPTVAASPHTTDDNQDDNLNLAGIENDLFAALDYNLGKENFEKEFILRALKAYNGGINLTAEKTNMTKVTLLRKLAKYGINAKQFKNRPSH